MSNYLPGRIIEDNQPDNFRNFQVEYHRPEFDAKLDLLVDKVSEHLRLGKYLVLERDDDTAYDFEILLEDLAKVASAKTSGPLLSLSLKLQAFEREHGTSGYNLTELDEFLEELKTCIKENYNENSITEIDQMLQIVVNKAKNYKI